MLMATIYEWSVALMGGFADGAGSRAGLLFSASMLTHLAHLHLVHTWLQGIDRRMWDKQSLLAIPLILMQLPRVSECRMHVATESFQVAELRSV
jgi:hypothetical protein